MRPDHGKPGARVNGRLRPEERLAAVEAGEAGLAPALDAGHLEQEPQGAVAVDEEHPVRHHHNISSNYRPQGQNHALGRNRKYAPVQQGAGAVWRDG